MGKYKTCKIVLYQDFFWLLGVLCNFIEIFVLNFLLLKKSLWDFDRETLALQITIGGTLNNIVF